VNEGRNFLKVEAKSSPPWSQTSLLGLGAVSSGNMDQDMCFEISDPCFLEKYAKFIHW
jgi:hypothetical protein